MIKLDSRYICLLLGVLALSGVFGCAGSSAGSSGETSPLDLSAQAVASSSTSHVSEVHLGPMNATPEAFDCGHVPDLSHCEFDIMLTLSDVEEVEIQSVSQDFSPFARLGLVEHRTGFGRDLPYVMRGEDQLRLIFSYRRDDPGETIGGGLFVNYVFNGETFRLGVPVNAE